MGYQRGRGRERGCVCVCVCVGVVTLFGSVPLLVPFLSLVSTSSSPLCRALLPCLFGDLLPNLAGCVFWPKEATKAFG